MRVARDELLILREFTGRDEPARQVLGPRIELARDRQGSLLVRAEQCAAELSGRQELPHLRGERPGIEQGRHRRQAGSRTLTLRRRADLPAQRIRQHLGIAVVRRDVVGALHDQRDEMVGEFARENARIQIATREWPLRSLQGDQRTTRNTQQQRCGCAEWRAGE